MRNIHNRSTLVVIVLLSVLPLSCSVTKQIQEAFANLTRCKFKLASVSNFSISGISLQGKSSYSIMDGATLAAAFARNQIPASFTLNVAAINPNDGTGGTSAATATLSSLAWTLLIDSTVTINGDIASPISIPGTGQETIIPLKMSLDLAKFFKEKGYEHIINLALALGGSRGSPSRITLRAKPTIQTDFGPISYPGELQIVDKEFR